jgi:hypothetical protein
MAAILAATIRMHDQPAAGLLLNHAMRKATSTSALVSDANISRSLHQSLIEGFMEDKYLIEAQQKVLDADPSFKMRAVAADTALSHFR